MLGDPRAELEEPRLMVLRRDPRERDHGTRMGIVHEPLDVDRRVREVDGDEIADAPLERRRVGVRLLPRRIEQPPADAPEVEVLRRERRPPPPAPLSGAGLYRREGPQEAHPLALLRPRPRRGPHHSGESPTPSL